MEMLIVVAFTAAVGIALQGALQYFYRTNAYVFEESAAVDSARKGITSALSDLREASYGDDGSYPVGNAATSTVSFFADVDTDGAIEKIRYYLSGTTLYRGVTDSAGSPPSYTGQPEITYTIADNVRMGTSTPVFRYYDHAGAELSVPASPSALASVYMQVTVDVNPNRTPNALTLTGTATLRNLRQY